jgi:hypothetical protein
MAGRGVHEAGTGIVGDVIAVDQRHGEIIAAAEAAQRVGADHAFKVARSYIAQTLELSLALAKHSSAKRIGEDQLLARLEGRNRSRLR